MDTALNEHHTVQHAYDEKRADQTSTNTILLAEDDEGIRYLATYFLEEAGYRVLVAEDGAEAISLFDAYMDCIDLAILDKNMPHGNGCFVFEHIFARRPQLPVIFSSGCPLEEELSAYPNTANLDTLTKPYRREELFEKISNNLEVIP